MTISRRNALGLSGAVLAGGALASATSSAAATKGAPLAKPGTRWWMDQPVRMALFLYNQYQAPVDTDHFVEKLVDLNVNAVVLPTAGIAAFYPTKVPFHTIAPSVPPGRDLMDEIVRKAHARGIYVVSRFEWTVHQDPRVMEVHPDWVQRDANGNSPLWNDTRLMCINGGYMQEHAFKIMAEVLDRYPIDGMFFNYGGGQRNAFGPCHCENCKRLYRAKYNADIPARPDDNYRAFMNESAGALTDRMGTFVRSKSPGMNYMVGRNADSTNSETHSAPLATSHAYWLYDASETVNRARAAFPDRMQFNNDAAFFEGRWRYAHRSAPDGEIRAYQNMANGAGPYLFVNGPIDQFDRNGEKGARPAFKFHKDHEELYVRQENAARVLLLDRPSLGSLASILFGGGQHASDEGPAPGNGGFGYNDGGDIGSGFGVEDTALPGFFRLLTESHVPFVLSRDLSWIEKEPDKYDLVVCSSGAPAELDRYLRQGGRVLVAGSKKPDLEIPPVVKLWKRRETLSSYWRVQDRDLLPSLTDADLVFLYSDYLELEPRGKSALTFVPPTKINPMEKVGEAMKDTNKPGLYAADYGRGKLAYIPWDIGDLYYRASAPHHAAIVNDLIDHLLPNGRQIRTNAHPMVQMTLQRQAKEKRTLVHLVNLSGCSQVAYHPAIPMSGVQIEVQGRYTTARMASTGRDLPIRRSAGYTGVTLPTLDTYDVVVLT